MSEDISTYESEDEVLAEEADTFDERSFLRRIRMKSALRIVVIAVAIVAISWVAILLGGYKWQALTMREAARIDHYYTDLVAVTNPNTWVLGDSVTRLHFPNASNDYASFRLIGSRAVPAGVRSMDFDIWTPEYPRGYDERLTTLGVRVFSGNELVPELRILHPGAADDVYLAETGIKARDIISEFERITAESVARLESTPVSHTAEVAFSFDKFLTLTELQSFAPTGTTLAWGAVSVWEPEDMPPLPLINAGSMVGVPFTSPDTSFGYLATNSPQEAEDQLPGVLRGIASRSKLPAASRALQAAEVIERDGARYYGVVLTGPPTDLLTLARDPRVTAVAYGLSVGSWE